MKTTQRRRQSGSWARGIPLLALLMLGGSASAQVSVQAIVSHPGGTVCSGIVTGMHACPLADGIGRPFTVTWSLSAPTSINGYDLTLQWDPTKISLVSAAQLFPDGSPPNTIPFLAAPNANGSAGSSATTLSLVASPTTALFSVTFNILSSLISDCVPDLSWVANGNGLAPASVVLQNPEGASIDLGVITQCTDGLDNEGDGKVDFDGGTCAGNSTLTPPDPECVEATTPSEAPPARSCGLGFELALVLPMILAVRSRRRRGAAAHGATSGNAR